MIVKPKSYFSVTCLVKSKRDSKTVRLPTQFADRLVALESFEIVDGTELLTFEPLLLSARAKIALLVEYACNRQMVAVVTDHEMRNELWGLCDDWRSDGLIWGGSKSGEWCVLMLDPIDIEASKLETTIREAREAILGKNTGLGFVRTKRYSNDSTEESASVVENVPPCLEPLVPPSADEGNSITFTALATRLVYSSIEYGDVSECPYYEQLRSELSGLCDECEFADDYWTFTGELMVSFEVWKRWSVVLYHSRSN